MPSITMNTTELLQCAYGNAILGEHAPKLPKPPILAFDHVMELNTEGGEFGYGYAIARKSFADMDWVFASHFDADPVMPGTMMIEGMLQLGGLIGGFRGGRGKGRAVRIDGVKLLGEVVPEDGEVTYRVDIRKDMKNHSLFVAKGTVSSGGMVKAVADNLWLMIQPVVTTLSDETRKNLN